VVSIGTVLNSGVVNVCNKARWLSSPGLNDRHWSLMDDFEPLLDKRKESVLLVSVLYSAD
jgi:hypothetical protein